MIPRRLADLALGAAATAAAALTAACALWMLLDLAWRGAAQLSPALLGGEVLDAGRAGGLGPVLASTGLILLVCIVTATPVALATALFLSEFAGRSPRAGRVVRSCLDALAGVPSVVFGLFGNALLCDLLGLGYSILAGGLTLAIMVLPLLVRVTEDGLRAVPDDWRRGAAALGLSRTATTLHITLPAALPALGAGLTLALARAAAETAALLFTSGYVPRTPSGLLDSGRALSVHIYDLAMNVPGGEPRAAASALVLAAALLLVHLTTHAALHRWRRRWPP